MTINSRWTWTVVALFTGFFLLAATGLGFLASGMTSHQAAAGLSQQLETASPEETPALLAQLAATGDAGIPLLVQHLNSPRAEVAVGARTELSNLLNHWRMLKASAASLKVALLAKELARQCKEFTPQGQHVAADFASRLLAWPVDRSAIDGARLIAHCGEVLRAGDGVLEPRREAVATTATAIPEKTATAARNLRYTDAVLRDPPEEIPVDIVGIPALPPSITPVAPQPVRDTMPNSPVEAPAPAIPGAPPRRLLPDGAPPEATPRSTPSTFTPGSLPGAYPPGPARPLQPREVDSSATGKTATPPHRSATQLVSANLPARTRNAADFEGVPLFEVVSALQSSSASIVGGALTELRKRGFQAEQIRLAEWFVDGDPAKRMELLRALPEAKLIDAQQWMLWLTYDTDPMIRKAAVQSLEGSQNAGVSRRLAQMELEEKNLEVLHHIQQITLKNSQQTNLR